MSSIMCLLCFFCKIQPVWCEGDEELAQAQERAARGARRVQHLQEALAGAERALGARRREMTAALAALRATVPRSRPKSS